MNTRIYEIASFFTNFSNLFITQCQLLVILHIHKFYLSANGLTPLANGLTPPANGFIPPANGL
jgi:hypothetical protein